MMKVIYRTFLLLGVIGTTINAYAVTHGWLGPEAGFLFCIANTSLLVSAFTLQVTSWFIPKTVIVYKEKEPEKEKFFGVPGNGFYYKSRENEA